MEKVIFIVLFVVMMFMVASGIGACSGNIVEEDIAVRALGTQGFSDIKIVKKDVWFVEFKGGGREDVVKFTARAINPAGKNVEVDVFAGWPWKGATIRSK